MKNIKRMVVYGMIYVLFFVALVLSMGMGEKSIGRQITVCAQYDVTDVLQVYYSETETFSEEQSVSIGVEATGTLESYTIELPEQVQYLRFDFGTIPGNTVDIDSVQMNNLITKQSANIIGSEFGQVIEAALLNGSEIVESSESGLHIIFMNEDPYVQIDMAQLDSYLGAPELDTWGIMKYVVSGILAALVTLFVFKFVFLKDICLFLKDIIRNRKLLLSLAINDFKVKFAGSYFGIVWAFVQPICTIAVFWFVFEMGFRSGAVSEMPYALWLSVGLVPWFFFSDSWNGATNTFMEYSYLVKKVVFKIEILPLVKILSALFVHLFFILFLCGMFLANGVALSIHVLGVFYYMVCLIAFVVGLSFLTSSIVVFFKDLTQIIAIILQFGMWLTPIMWQTTTFPENAVNIMRINPMFYIIEGYRSCFMISEPAPGMNQSVYFWFITILMFMVGTALFRRLKPHFADVL